MINEATDIGLHGNYWKGLKEYYENEYTGIVPGKFAIKCAKEMEQGDASVLRSDTPYDPDTILTWIEETMELVRDDEDPDIDYDNETIITFPNIESYEDYSEEIAAYFLLKDLDRFRDEISKENKEFIDEATRLNWMEMIEEIPSVKDIFIF